MFKYQQQQYNTTTAIIKDNTIDNTSSYNNYCLEDKRKQGKTKNERNIDRAREGDKTKKEGKSETKKK